MDGTVNREVPEQRRAEMLREAALNRLEEARVAGLLGKSSRCVEQPLVVAQSGVDGARRALLICVELDVGAHE